MTKEEHLARINQKIADADEVHTGALADEVAGLWAAVDGAAGALRSPQAGAFETRTAEARAVRWLSGMAIGTPYELLILADQIESGAVVVP
jgi:hypothetical protein